MRHRKRIQEKACLPSTKRRRLILKQERVVTQGANEALEGSSYQSGIGLAVADVDVEHLQEASFWFSARKNISSYHTDCSISGRINIGVFSLRLSKIANLIQRTADHRDNHKQQRHNDIAWSTCLCWTSVYFYRKHLQVVAKTYECVPHRTQWTKVWFPCADECIDEH